MLMVFIFIEGAYENFAPAVEAYWKFSGGDLCIAPRIPKIFKSQGIELIDFKPVSLAGGPGSGVFEWHHSFLTHHVPLMVEKGLLSAETGDAIVKDWNDHRNNPDSLFFSPIVVNVSGRKL
jgi:hypothetical protein